MPDKVRWGILGTGNIAHQFARGLPAADEAELVAVGSRTQDHANKFGDEFGVPRRHATYEALAADPGIDAVYVATPHPFHKDNTLMCLNEGKAVLCEKPFAINADQAEQMVAASHQLDLPLIEAVWTRFSPVMVKIRELLAQGAIGEVRLIQADFGFRTQFNPKGRLFDLALGGGALLDVGIYPISLASMILGEPAQIASTAHLGETGVDEQNAILLTYPQGQIAILSSAIRTQTPWEALIAGTDGMIRIEADWWRAQQFTLKRNGQPDEVFKLPFKGNGYEYEAMEVGRCLRAGELESPVIPHAETLSIMRIMGKIRAQWGLVYPMEQA